MTMVNIYQILKNKSRGTPLYSPMLGNVVFDRVTLEKDIVVVTSFGVKYVFNQYGQYCKEGEVMLKL